MSRLHGILGTLAVLALFLGLALLGNANLGLSAVLILIAGAASVAAQGILQPMFSAVRLKLSPMFRRGDYVSAGNVAGHVVNFDAFTVELRDDDGRLHYVPTTLVTGGIVSVGKAEVTP